MPVISGTAFWSHVAEPNTKGKYPSGKYEISLGKLDKTAIKTLSDLGLGKFIRTKKKAEAKFEDEPEKLENFLKYKEDELPFIILKNKFKPVIIDTDKNEYPEDTLIGNGSKVKVQVKTMDTDDGSFAYFTKVMILELVDFKNPEDDEDWGNNPKTVVKGGKESTDSDDDEFDDEDPFGIEE